jgi:aldehyde dehydrogenase (NAD(P)+)
MDLNKNKTVDTVTMDKKIEILQANKRNWAVLALRNKIKLLQELKHKVDQYSNEWADAGMKAKGIDKDTAGVGEEWISGPWAMLASLTQLIKTLEELEKGQQRKPASLRTRHDGQLIAKVFPTNIFDHLLLNGVTGEVWMQPGVTQNNLDESTAEFYKQKAPKGLVSLVLGAGNISSIAPLDILYKLYAEGSVCLLKMNPVNDYLGPVFEKIFDAFISAGFVEMVYGGADVGAYLTSHKDIESIHITGSHLTHDVIVYGSGDDGQKRKQKNEPLLKKPITSELGGCCPTIVVPGPWTEADLKFQAEHIVTQKYHNGGFNCIASQVLVLPEDWDMSSRLLDNVEETFRTTTRRKAYYPGAAIRQKSAVSAYPEATLLDPNEAIPRTFIKGIAADSENNSCFNEEFFGAVYAQTSLPGASPFEYLKNAVEFCNEKLSGTLGANIIIHPKTIQELGPRLEDCIADLKYGGIGVNAWSGLVYLLSSCSWGAFPGHTYDDIQSGIGVVHNSFLFDKPQKSVVYANFHPFPRAIAEGQLHLSPRPPWFVTNKKAHTLGRKLAKFEAKPGFSHIPGIFLDALRG